MVKLNQISKVLWVLNMKGNDHKWHEDCHPSRQYFLTQITQIWHILDCLILPNTIWEPHPSLNTMDILHVAAQNPWPCSVSTSNTKWISTRTANDQQVHQSGYINAHHRKFRSLVGHLFRCFPSCPIHHLFGIPATAVVFFFWTPLGPMQSQKTGLLDHGVMVRKATASTAPWYFFQPRKRVGDFPQPGLVGDYFRTGPLVQVWIKKIEVIYTEEPSNLY